MCTEFLSGDILIVVILEKISYLAVNLSFNHTFVCFSKVILGVFVRFSKKKGPERMSGTLREINCGV